MCRNENRMQQNRGLKEFWKEKITRARVCVCLVVISFTSQRKCVAVTE